MNSFNTADLKPEMYFTQDLTLDKSFLLLPTSVPLSKEILDALNDWEFTQVYSEGNITTTSQAFDYTVIEEEEEQKPKEKPNLGEAVRKIMENASIENAEADTNADTSRLDVVQKVYSEYLNYINAVYTRYATHKELNLEEISATVKELCIFIKENCRYVLRFQPSQGAKNKSFLVSHSMRSTILAITIGMQLRLPLSKLIELGVAAILHEIGMIRIPPQTYMNDRPLTAAEKRLMFTHPILGYGILKNYDCPLSICLGVLEHHERENGSGYPRHLTSDKISLYAKIIAVACNFEAITAPRDYKEEQSSYEAMIEMLKNNRQIYDENVIKALLCKLSLFPIGSYVYLSDGKLGQVVDVNPENPRNPLVQILTETEPNGDPKIRQTSDTGLRILRALSKEETLDIKKALGTDTTKEKSEAELISEEEFLTEA